MRTVARRLVPVAAAGLVLSASVGCGGRAEPGETALPAPSPTRGFITDIERATVRNEDYRRVLFTGERMQLVLMSLEPGEEIGVEMHQATDQFFRFEAGTGRVVMNGEPYEVEDGTALVIPAGVEHNVINTGDAPLRFYTLYSPPEHPPGTVHRTKAEAEAARHGG